MIPLNKQHHDSHQRIVISKMQEGMILDSISDLEHGSYLLQIIIDLEEKINPCLLKKAWSLIIKANPVLRTQFEINKSHTNEYYAYIKTAVDLSFEEINIKKLSRKMYQKMIDDDKKKTIDVSRTPLFRLKLIKKSDCKYALIWTLHHALMAGDSIVKIIQEVFQLYDALSQHELYPLQKREPIHEDYREYLSNFDNKIARSYWKNLFYDFSSPINFKTFNDNQEDALESRHIVHYISIKDTNYLKKFVSANAITLGTLIQTAWAILLAKYTSQEDVVFGIVRALPAIPTEGLLGMFINTLPVRIKILPGVPINEVFSQVKQQQKNQNAYLQSTISMIHTNTALDKGVSLFNSIIDYKPQHPSIILKKTSEKFHNRLLNFTTNTPYQVSLEVCGFRERMQLRLTYQCGCFSDELAKRLLRYYKRYLLELANERNKFISDLRYLSKHEIKILLKDFNATKRVYTKYQTITDLIKKQVKYQPNSIAVEFEQDKLSYLQLDRQSSQLAKVLLSHQLSNKIIAMFIKPGVAVVVGLLAVLKVNCTYLPIDPDSPEQRMLHILLDSKASAVLTTRTEQQNLEYLFDKHCISALCIAVDDEQVLKSAISHGHDKKPKLANPLAYIIYTSGSTGLPKGVEIKHSSLLNLVCWHKEYYQINSLSRISQIANISFDAATWSIWAALASGARLCIVADDIKHDPSKLIEWHTVNKITHSFVPTSLAEILITSIWPKHHDLKVLLTGGDVLHKTCFVKQKFAIANHYGPTENTVVATVAYVEPSKEIPSIGRPIANVKLYVLDSQHKLLPIGFRGELYIGGKGVANGYLNNHSLTSDKFIKNPFDPSEYIYRTGDCVEWRTDGSLKFIGRLDSQVKISGYRIELKEIETALMQYHAIQLAVVILTRQIKKKLLIAFYVNICDKPVNNSDLHKYLATKLPFYMLPARYIEIKSLPMNSSGKCDKNILENIYTKSIENITIVKPSSETFDILRMIWSEALAVNYKDIRPDSNYFELGGDSIIALKIVNACEGKKIFISVKELFKYPGISELTNFIDQNKQRHKSVPTHKKVVLYIPMTPIQKWFFSKYAKNPGHFNQICQIDMLFNVDQMLLEQSLKIVINYHDAFHLNYKFDKKKLCWRQFYKNSVNLAKHFYFNGVNIQKIPSWKQQKIIRQENKKLQKVFELDKAPLLQANYYKLSPKHSILCFTVHHLIVDGVSWRIILEDLQTVYHQLVNHTEIKLPQKTDNYYSWSIYLREFLQNNHITSEFSYWLGQLPKESYLSRVKNFAIDKVTNIKNMPSINTYGNSKTFTICLNSISTSKLLYRKHSLQAVGAKDYLLAALLMTLGDQEGNERVLYLDQETHGREVINSNCNVSRTEGWFTSFKPIRLASAVSADTAKIINDIKVQSESMPYNGIGYGILAYLSRSKNIRLRLQKQRPLIVFNYLGQFRNSAQNQKTFPIDNFNISLDAGKYLLRDHILDIDCMIYKGELRVQWTYCKYIQSERLLKKIARRYIKYLGSFIDYKMVLSSKNDVLDMVPPDMHRDGNSYSYALSGMQEGLVFHSTLLPESLSYRIQSILYLRGELYDALLQRAWTYTVQSHDILHTVFRYDNENHLTQVVVNNSLVEWKMLDLSRMSKVEKHRKLKEALCLDREMNFNLAVSPPIRCMLVRIDHNNHRLIISYHHILLDGWSFFLILHDLFKVYTQLYSKIHRNEERKYSYKNYIDWLQLNHDTNSKIYWQNYLQCFTKINTMSIQTYTSKVKTLTQDENKQQLFSVEKELLARLLQFARMHNLTVNSIVQSAWSIILRRYCNDEDIVFGITSSHRPTSIPNINKIVGLMITTLPCRVRFNKDMTVLEFFNTIQSANMEFFSHQNTRLSDIKSWLNIEGRAELFNYLYIFENYPRASLIMPMLKLNKIVVHEQNHFPLSLVVIYNRKLQFKIQYQRSLFKKSNIINLLTYLKNVINNMISSPNVKINELNLYNRGEVTKEISLLNATEIDFGSAASLLDLWYNAVKKHNDKISYICNNENLTYEQLNKRVITIAKSLIQFSNKKTRVVAIFLDRSIAYIVSVLSVLKLGYIYLPIDKSLPKLRIEYILKDSHANILITENNLLPNLPTLDPSINTVLYDYLLNDTSSRRVKLRNTVHNKIAYLLYTSGSTGVPKGVLIKHGSLVNFLFAMKKNLCISKNDNFLAITSFCFDISGLELYLSYITGSRVILLTENTNSKMIIEAIDTNNVTVIQATPATWKMLLHAGFKPNRKHKLLCGGDVMPLDLTKKLLANGASLWNVYGPTETTVWSTMYQVPLKYNDSTSIPIGKPIANTKIYVLDNNQNLLPPDLIGELYIGGKGLAHSYLNMSAMTHEKFIIDPFSKDQYQRLYKTGDLVQWRDDGNLNFIARLDSQVKIRGFRIELSEIETNLIKHMAIAAARVLAIEPNSTTNDKMLVAFLQAKKLTAIKPTHSELKNFLSLYLPSYMVPDHYQYVDIWPLTSNNKLDIDALKNLCIPVTQHDNADKQPLTPDEKKIANIWAKVLSIPIDSIKSDSNFYDAR